MFLPTPALTARAARKTTAPGLVLMRTVYCAFVSATVLVCVVLILLGYGWKVSSAATGIAIVIVLSALALIAVAVLNGRRIRGDDAATVLASYRTTVFRKTMVAEAPLVAAFVIVFLDGSIAPYVVAAICGIPSWYLAAPTARDIGLRQDQLRSRGSAVDLLGALAASLRPDADA
jgi:hypothetical protein